MYDQVVSCGEMISSKILSEYLNDINFSNAWLDARDYIKTDDTYREGVVNWQETEKEYQRSRPESIVCYQRFHLVQKTNNTVTLGREGSDYSASDFALV